MINLLKIYRKILKRKLFDRTYMILEEIDDGYGFLGCNFLTLKSAKQKLKKINNKKAFIVKLYLY